MHPRGDKLPMSERNRIWEAELRARGLDPKAMGYPKPEFQTHELEHHPQDKPQK
jgi:hypothetical protein